MSQTFIISHNPSPKPKLSHFKIPSPSQKKPFSTVIRELDYNSYRAYKMSSDLSLSNSSLPQSRNISNIILKSSYKHNAMKLPFGLKSKRFLWQTDHTFNCIQDINGKMKNYTITPYRRNSPLKTNNPSIRHKILGLNFARNYAINTDLNSFRTITPEKDVSRNGTIQPPRRRLLRSHTTGSIANLLRKTPENKNVKVRNEVGKESGVFTEEFYNWKGYRREKMAVDLEGLRRNRSFAGNRKGLDVSGDGFLYREDKGKGVNVARRMKMKYNESDIFHLKKNGNEIYNKKGMRKYSFTYNQNQDEFFSQCK